MAADVTHHQRRATPNRVIAPGEPIVGVGVVLACLATLDVLDLHQADLPELPFGHHGPSLPDHRIPRVVVSEAEDEPCLSNFGHQVESVVEGVGDRFVTDHIESEVEGGSREQMVRVVGGHDGDHVRPVIARRLGPDQFEPVPIGTARVEPDGDTRCT